MKQELSCIFIFCMFSHFFANWVLIKEGDKVHKSRNLRRSGTDASRIKTHHLRRPRDKTKGKGKLELWFLVRPMEI